VRILIVGLTTRAIAESAVRAGCDVVAVDYFGDLDSKQICPNISLRDRDLDYSAAALARVAREISYDAVAYCGSLENHPDVVAELAHGKSLLGNSPDALRRVRDPAVLLGFLAGRGFLVPETIGGAHGRALPTRGWWLVKPAAGGGGQGIRIWHGEALHGSQVLQELVPGIPASAVFVGDGHRSALLGWSELLAAGTGFRYGGNLFPLEAPRAARDEITGLVEALTEEFSLVGVNGVDFVLNGDRPVVLEVNPRYSASMELIERASGIGVFRVHLDGCAGRLPDARERSALDAALDRRACHGKRIVYARERVCAVNPAAWIARGVRDVPHPGEVIEAGHPICTVLASGATRVGCVARLHAEEAAVVGWCSPGGVAPQERGA
jgi:hypothetical protein